MLTDDKKRQKKNEINLTEFYIINNFNNTFYDAKLYTKLFHISIEKHVPSFLITIFFIQLGTQIFNVFPACNSIFYLFIFVRKNLDYL